MVSIELLSTTERWYIIRTIKKIERSMNFIPLFKVTSDPSRLKILLIIKENSFCVNDLANILGITKSAISHQLRLLRDKSYVSKVKKGKKVFYRISNTDLLRLLSYIQMYEEWNKFMKSHEYLVGSIFVSIIPTLVYHEILKKKLKKSFQ